VLLTVWSFAASYAQLLYAEPNHSVCLMRRRSRILAGIFSPSLPLQHGPSLGSPGLVLGLQELVQRHQGPKELRVLEEVTTGGRGPA
jgi:hypothetical protein